MQRATASLAKAAELNPFVTVDALTDNAGQEDEQFFEGYQVVLVSNQSTAAQVCTRAQAYQSRITFGSNGTDEDKRFVSQSQCYVLHM